MKRPLSLLVRGIHPQSSPVAMYTMRNNKEEEERNQQDWGRITSSSLHCVSEINLNGKVKAQLETINFFFGERKRRRWETEKVSAGRMSTFVIDGRYYIKRRERKREYRRKEVNPQRTTTHRYVTRCAWIKPKSAASYTLIIIHTRVNFVTIIIILNSTTILRA